MADNRYFEPVRLPTGTTTAATADERVTSFLKRVYGWMFVGLSVTAGVALFVASQPALVQAIARTGFLFFALVIAQIGLVVWISARVKHARPFDGGRAVPALLGAERITFAFILLAYTGQSIASAFITTAGMFGALALYGSMTKRSLAGLGQFAFMGLIGIVIASLVGLFWQNDTLQFMISAIGVIVFTGLTAYDAQRLKAMALQSKVRRWGPMRSAAHSRCTWISSISS